MDHWKQMNLWERFLILLVTVLVAMIAFFLIMAARADGRADFCYVSVATSQHLPLYTAEAHRPWRPDATLGYGYTMEEVVMIARKAGCSKLYTEAP